jgi:hypothetical protein
MRQGEGVFSVDVKDYKCAIAEYTSSVALRDELHSLHFRFPERPEPPFPELTRLARSVASRSVGRDSVEDLVNDFLTDLLQRREVFRASQSRGDGERTDPVKELSDLDDGALTAAVRRRLRQLAAEARPRWNLYRALRQHVFAVLPTLPTPPLAPPSSLQSGTGHHLSRELVAAALSWLLAQPEAPARDPTAVATRLLQIYFPNQERRAPGHAEAVDPDADPETRTRRSWDGERLMRELRRLVSNERKLEAFVRRCSDQPFQQISGELGVSLATAHAWVAEVTKAFRFVVEYRSASAGTVIAALAWEKTARELSLPKTETKLP